jgi:DNA polymerase-1
MISAKQSPPVDILILDTVFMLYRSFLATPPLTNSKNEPTSALHGGFGAFFRICRELKPKHIVFALEGCDDHSGWRSDLYPGYKADRKPFPPEFAPQMNIAIDLASHLGIHCIECPKMEADDVIASLCTTYKNANKVIFTTDKDIISLTDENTRIYQKIKKRSNLLEVEDVSLKWQGIQPAQILDVLSLTGDSVDSVPGVPKVGIKTAIPLILQYGTLQNIYAHLDELPKGLQTKLTEGRQSALLSQQLTRMRTDLDVTLPPITKNLEAAKTIAAKYELNSVSRVIEAQLPDGPFIA